MLKVSNLEKICSFSTEIHTTRNFYRIAYQSEIQHQLSWGSCTSESAWSSNGWCASGGCWFNLAVRSPSLSQLGTKRKHLDCLHTYIIVVAKAVYMSEAQPFSKTSISFRHLSEAQKLTSVFQNSTNSLKNTCDSAIPYHSLWAETVNCPSFCISSLQKPQLLMNS